jgi:hypothetical protein
VAKDKDQARLSIIIPNDLKETLEELAEFPYKSVTNAAVVLMREALNNRSGQPKPTKDEIIEAFIEMEATDLIEVALRALEKLHLVGFQPDRLSQWALEQISAQSEIALERLQKIRGGDHMTAKELEKLARVFKTTPPEVEKILQGECCNKENGDAH